MSALTKEEQRNWRSADTLHIAMNPAETLGFIMRALDTIGALEATLAEVREILSRAGIPGEDEDRGVPHGVEELWLSYAGANHLLPKYTEKSWALESELLHTEALLENLRRTIGAALEGAHIDLDEMADFTEGTWTTALHGVQALGVMHAIATRHAVNATQDLARIRTYALEHSTTLVIGGAHAALRKIAEMAGGEK